MARAHNTHGNFATICDEHAPDGPDRHSRLIVGNEEAGSNVAATRERA